jgi:hypothetical protein
MALIHGFQSRPFTFGLPALPLSGLSLTFPELQRWQYCQEQKLMRDKPQAISPIVKGSALQSEAFPLFVC